MGEGGGPVRLVLAEKPSVAMDLARVMDPGARRAEGRLDGRQFTWTWALGHLVELAPPEHYRPDLKGRWRLDRLPVLPDRFVLRPREGRTAQLQVIRGLLAKAEAVIVATDAGREGELIWAYIAEVCGYTGPASRLWLSEGTPAAVRSAFAALRPPMGDLADAARARGAADWLVGMNATMALSARHGGLWSAGRVQTPTLALLCRREAEIREFRPEQYFVVLGDFVSDAHRYAGRWFRDQQDRLPDKEAAEAVVARVRGKVGRVASVIRKRAEESPPRLFNLTDLQRAANARFGMTAARTLAAAQSLYERHKALSYPRTDSQFVSAETFRTFPARLRAVQGPPAAVAGRLVQNLPHPGRRVVDDRKVTDHHALLPTAQAPAVERLSEDERRVYELVVRRFLAALLPWAEYDETVVVTEVAGETFRSRARVLVVEGWREVEPPAAATTRSGRSGARGRGKAGSGADAAEEPADMDVEAGDVGSLREGGESICEDARFEQRQTKAPPRYTEATLLRVMETAGRLVDDEVLADAMRARGLGTPATRAAIIETLVKREYVRREKRSLVPTQRGEALVGLAPAELRDPATTGAWEERLGAIETGRVRASEFLEDIAALTTRMVADVGRQERTVVVAPAASATPAPTRRGRVAGSAPLDGGGIGVCPLCGGAIVEGRKGFGCSRWRRDDGGCRWVLWKLVAGKRLTVNQARDLITRGVSSRVLRGFRSKDGSTFAARLRLEAATGRVSFLFDTPPAGAGADPVAARAPSGRTRRARPSGSPATGGKSSAAPGPGDAPVRAIPAARGRRGAPS